jgi:hypothetical protein
MTHRASMAHAMYLQSGEKMGCGPENLYASEKSIPKEVQK